MEINNVWSVKDNYLTFRRRCDDIISKWRQTGMLYNLDDDMALACAITLENQRLTNEIEDSFSDPFRRISIPMVRRIIGGSILGQIASIQPQLMDEKCEIYYNCRNQNGEWLRSMNVEKQLWTYKAILAIEELGQSKGMFNLDQEAEYTAVVAQEVALEMDRRALMMIRKVATKSVCDWGELTGTTIKEKAESIVSTLEEMSNGVANKIGHKCNWIVTPPELSILFETNPDFKASNFESYFGLGVQYIGKCNGYRIYKDPLFPTSQIMMGYKGKTAFDSGLVWAPDVMFAITPKSEGSSYNKLIGSHDMKIVDEGEKYYTYLSVVNYVM